MDFSLRNNTDSDFHLQQFAKLENQRPYFRLDTLLSFYFFFPLSRSTFYIYITIHYNHIFNYRLELDRFVVYFSRYASDFIDGIEAKKIRIQNRQDKQQTKMPSRKSIGNLTRTMRLTSSSGEEIDSEGFSEGELIEQQHQQEKAKKQRGEKRKKTAAKSSRQQEDEPRAKKQKHESSKNKQIVQEMEVTVDTVLDRIQAQKQKEKKLALKEKTKKKKDKKSKPQEEQFSDSIETIDVEGEDFFRNVHEREKKEDRMIEQGKKKNKEKSQEFHDEEDEEQEGEEEEEEDM